MPTLKIRNKRIALYNSFIVFALGLVLLITWHFDLAFVQHLFPSGMLSNPVSALCFILSALCFFLQLNRGNKFRLAATLLALFVLSVGMVRFVEIVFDYNTGIDKWLYPDKLIRYGHNGAANHMAPNTALGFWLLGLSFCLYEYRSKYSKYLSDFFAAALLLVSFLSVVGYLYKSVELYHIDSFVPMAFPTAFSFFLISVALLLRRSSTGMLRVFTTRYEGSKMARFLLPFAVLVPVVTGMLHIYGEQLGWYTSHFGVTLFAVSNVIVFAILIWWCSINLNKSAVTLRKEMVLRRRLEDQLLQLNKELEEKVIERTHQLLKTEEEKLVLQTRIMEDKIHYQKKLMQASLEGQEKEKKQIGMELHDHINQVLASAKLTLEIGKASPELKDEMIDRGRSQIVLAINEIRSLSKSLVVHSLEEGGIEEGVSEIIEIIKRSKAIDFTTHFSKQALNSIEKPQQTAIYRIVQEQLNNIVKHAEASHVLIHLYEKEDCIYLLIEDNGKGFDTNSKKAGIGLSNIRSRVEAFYGEVEIISEIGKGCSLIVRFPIHQITEA